jgi:hypothetical protein
VNLSVVIYKSNLLVLFITRNSTKYAHFSVIYSAFVVVVAVAAAVVVSSKTKWMVEVLRLSEISIHFKGLDV